MMLTATASSEWTTKIEFGRQSHIWRSGWFVYASFAKAEPPAGPFPTYPNYDAKAWRLPEANRSAGDCAIWEWACLVG